MNDFSFQPKDMSAKVGGLLYPTEPSPLSRPNNLMKSYSFSQPQDYDQWRSNSLPASTLSLNMPTTTTTTTTTNMNIAPLQQPSSSSSSSASSNMSTSAAAAAVAVVAAAATTSNNMNNPAINPASCDLQEVILYYQSQPELLRLILLSKVEEDKRKAEEAKLRAKELDMLLLQQQQQQQPPLMGTPQTPDASILSGTTTSATTTANAATTTPPLPSSANYPSTHPLLANTAAANQFRRQSALEMLMDDSDCNRRDSALGSSFDSNANPDDTHPDDDRHNTATSFLTNHSTSAAANLLSMSFPPQPLLSLPTTTTRHSLHPLSPAYTTAAALSTNATTPNATTSPYDPTTSTATSTTHFTSSLHSMTSPSSSTPSSSSTLNPSSSHDATSNTTPRQQQHHRHENGSYFPQRPRRRREMQAISKIVETRDYPYVDGYFWKNNGNTIQKKTGNKSVYYKCSNSGKGCPVNKTVTWKENGEYLIKYRGEHLPECGKVQRIVDM